MTAPTPDPYAVLAVSRTADDAEVRAAYRRLVKLHHPDHNPGDPDAARRFEEIQEAYAALARPGGGRTDRSAPPPRQPPPRQPPRRPPPASTPADPALDARLADLERQVREARSARERAERAAREAAAALRREAAAAARADAGAGAGAGAGRPSDDELGYVHTEDTLGEILADARAELSERLARGREHPVARRVSDLIAGLEDLADGLDRRPPRGKPKS